MPEHPVIVISDDSNSEPSHPVRKAPSSKKCTAKSEDTEDRPAKRHASNPAEVIEIFDSSNDELSPKAELDVDHSTSPTRHSHTSSEPEPKLKPIEVQNSGMVNEELRKDGSGRVIVTRKQKVDVIEYLDGVPSRWPVPAVDTAYVLDFSDNARLLEKADTVKGKPKGLDAFLKAEVSCCCLLLNIGI